jgi:transcriptional regulator with GAF, ATPase, and Fis domain
LELQSKLLRVLQEGTFERVGSEKTQNVDVRIIAATNRDLKSEVEKGRFREDLYYRLNIFPVEVLPLRKRKDDIPALALHFMELAANKFKYPLRQLSRANILQLQSYSWPGNVRELQNVIERAVISSRSSTLRFTLPLGERLISSPTTAVKAENSEGRREIMTEEEMKRLDRENILAALDQTGWKIFGRGGAAELLDMRPTTLASRMKKMGLKKPA